MTPLLTVKSITKQFAATPVVKDVSFTVYPGEIFALLGPSGCGKTTTLRIVAGFETADTGTIAMAERPLADGRYPHPTRIARHRLCVSGLRPLSTQKRA